MSRYRRIKTAPKSGQRALSGKTVVKLFTQDGVRELLIPSDEPNYYPVVMSNDRLRTLEQQATKKEEKDPIQERERQADLSRQRKARFRDIDLKSAGKKQHLSQFEQEAKEKANYVLRRAWEQRMEQEDEIKAANSLILKTKCQAIRDAQLTEQALIKKQLQDDESHVDKAMEQERLRKLLEENRNLEKQRCKKEAYIRELNIQINEIHNKKILEFEKTLQDRQRLNEAMNYMMREEVEKRMQAEREKERTRRELTIANERIKRAHLIAKEEARLADVKVQEWMRQRAEREEAQERELAEARMRKELETARLRAQQEKAGELQAQQDHMMAVRRQEEYEREWRRKEKEAHQKRKIIDDKCLEVRKKQLDEKREIQANEMAREKRELERIEELQKEAEANQRELLNQRRRDAKKYREELLRQMNEKEAELIAHKNQNLAEGIAIRAEVAKREQEIRQVLLSKVEQMKGHQVPEVYVAEMMRQLHLHQGD